jgi:hypothetical protein
MTLKDFVYVFKFVAKVMPYSKSIHIYMDRNA